MNLDSKLKDWAVRHQAPQAHLDRLAARTVAEAARRRFVSAEPMRRRPQFLAKLSYAAAGAVVAGAVSVLCFRHGAWRLPEDKGVAAPRLARSTPDQVSAMNRVFSETARAYWEVNGVSGFTELPASDFSLLFGACLVLIYGLYVAGRILGGFYAANRRRIHWT